MTRSRAFTQVDVFAGDGLSGNPLAVVHDSDGLSTEQLALSCASHQGAEMHVSRVARWLGDLGLSEG